MKVLASLAVCAALAMAELAAPAAAGTICNSHLSGSASASTEAPTVTTAAPVASSTSSVGGDADDSADDAASGSSDDAASGVYGDAPSSVDDSDDGDASASASASASGATGDASVGDDASYSDDSSDDGTVGSEGSYGSSSSSSSNTTSTFKAVTSIQARVQGNKPYWRSDYEVFTSGYYDDFDVDYRAVLDTVNMAAVEGAFKYVQAECINASVVTNCTRKNSIKYVAFYETTIVQPEAAMAYYDEESDAYAPEHCPFMAMDGGQCDPNADGTFPDICNQYIGANGQPDLGFCVGGTIQDSEPIAPYPHNYWFSYPNSCPQEKWAAKTDECRAEQAGGLCAHGVEPDGVNCTFSYKILGYVLLDDVVGITSMINPNTLETYADYYEFCEAGGVEFSVSVLGDLVTLLESIPFWADPGNSVANAARAEALVTAYDLAVALDATTDDGGLMESLPSIASLTEANPPCYENSVVCSDAPYGCKRSYYSQICEVCSAIDTGCVINPSK